MVLIGMPTSEFAAQASEASSVLRSLSNEFRLLILYHLSMAEEMSLANLADSAGMGKTTVADHLAALVSSGLVSAREQGGTTLYRVGDPRVARLLEVLHDLFCPEGR